MASDLCIGKRKARTRANGEGTILYRAKQNSYEGRYYVTLPNGKRVRHSVYAKTKNEVGKKLRQALKEIDDGHVTVHGKMNFYQFYSIWKEDIAPHCLKETTIALYDDKLVKYILPKFGKKPLTNITSMDVQQLISYIYNKTKSPRTCRITRDAFSSVLKHAKKLNEITNNPVLGVELPQYKPKEKELWTPEELGIFLNYSKQHNQRLYTLCLIIATYGLRSGEGLGLRYEDIELFDGQNDEWGYIHINQQVATLKGKPIISTPKTQSSIRDLPITKEVHDALISYIESCDTRTGLLFHTKSERPISYRNFHRDFNIVINKCGLKQITPHALRHMAATNLRDIGVDIKTAQVILGHSDPATTMRIYQHSNMDNKKSALNKLSDLYGSYAIA